MRGWTTTHIRTSLTDSRGIPETIGERQMDGAKYYSCTGCGKLHGSGGGMGSIGLHVCLVMIMMDSKVHVAVGAGAEGSRRPRAITSIVRADTKASISTTT